MDTPITRAEHEEFRRSMEAEHERLAAEDKRQNRRIDDLEETVRQIGALAVSVEKLAVSMEGMLREQEQQGHRLEDLEGRDGEKWRKAMAYIGTALLGAVLAIVFAKIGFS